MRQAARLQLPVEENVLGLAAGHFPAIQCVANLVSEPDHAGTGLFDPCANDHLIVKASRGNVAARRFRYGQIYTAVLFHFAVIEASRPAKLHAGGFHPYEIVGVVDNAHLVGLGVPHADPRFMSFHETKIIAKRNSGPV